MRWFTSSSRLLLDDAGEPAELIGVAVDITDRRQAELERAAARDAEDVARDAVQTAQRRIEMMARVSVLVDTPLDLDATLQQIADLAITEMADWCVVDVRDDGVVHHAAVAHRDPAMVAIVKRIQERYPGDPDNPQVVELMRTLKPQFVREIPPDLVTSSAQDPEHLAAAALAEPDVLPRGPADRVRQEQRAHAARVQQRPAARRGGRHAGHGVRRPGRLGRGEGRHALQAAGHGSGPATQPFAGQPPADPRGRDVGPLPLRHDGGGHRRRLLRRLPDRRRPLVGGPG